MTTNATLIADIQGYVKDKSSATAERIARFLVRSGQDFWISHPWPERVAQGFITLIEPYDDGTITLTNADDTVAGASTTFTSAMVGRKIALAVTGPFYTIRTFSSTTSIDIDRVYPLATAATQSYLIYQDIYELAPDADALLGMQIAPHKANYRSMEQRSRSRVEREWGFPTGTGTPVAYCLWDRTATALRIRVGPMVPGEAGEIRYGYLKAYTGIDDIYETRRDIVLYGALAQTYMLHGRVQEAAMAAQTFERLTAQAWQREQALHPTMFGARGVDGARGVGLYGTMVLPMGPRCLPPAAAAASARM